MSKTKLDFDYELWIWNKSHADWNVLNHEINRSDTTLDKKLNEILFSGKK